MTFDHIFDQLEIQTEPFAICEIHGACHVALKPDAAVTLHYILGGEGQITMRAQPPIRISMGSLVLVPSLNSHQVLNDGATVVPGPTCKPAALNLAHVLKSLPDDDPSASRLVALCAHVTIGFTGASDVINLIREPLVARAEEGSALSSLVDTLMREVSEPRVGSRALIRALLLQAVINMMRDQVASQNGAMDWMTALRDPMIWKALSAMLDTPGNSHSVETLADIAGMSRAAFARRFAEAYGAGPMELLRSLRVRKAGECCVTLTYQLNGSPKLLDFLAEAPLVAHSKPHVGKRQVCFENSPERGETTFIMSSQLDPQAVSMWCLPLTSLPELKFTARCTFCGRILCR